MNPARFDRSALDAIGAQREVKLTTIGRRSGKPRTVTIWIATDGERAYVRSGGGLARDWPQNLLARGQATLRVGNRATEVAARHVADPDEARRSSRLAAQKYGRYVKASKAGEPLTKGETAVFELTPKDEGLR